MTEMADTVFLFDVDNTLLDNDRVQADLGVHLAKYYGEATRDRFWEIFEELRAELGYSDYLGALERYRLEAMHDPTLLRMASWMVDYPFHRSSLSERDRGREKGAACRRDGHPVGW